MSVPTTVAGLRRPRPLLSQRAEERLGPRHREVLDDLESLFLRDGFSGFSVRELAAHVGCSRRTLYELAPSKDELVLIVFDRFLHRVGRAALDSIDETTPFADQIRSYFRGGMELQRISQVFASWYDFFLQQTSPHGNVFILRDLASGSTPKARPHNYHRLYEAICQNSSWSSSVSVSTT